jgi:hypothetical protein
MMTNTYRALTPAAIAAYDEGVFERDFTPVEEKDALDSGLIELVPRKYKVLSNNFAAGDQDSEIEAAYLVEIEQALIAGGHIERVATKSGSTKKTAAVAADEKKED